MPAGGPVEIQGLKELRRGLKKAVGSSVNATVKKAHSEVSRFVLGKTKGTAAGRAPSRGPASSSRAAQRLARSFVPIRRVSGAGMRSPLPDAWGQEFGSKRFLRFPAHTGFGDGQVGEKAVADNKPEIGDMYIDKMMDLAFRKPYPDRA
jgi:hypothetical protein